MKNIINIFLVFFFSTFMVACDPTLIEAEVGVSTPTTSVEIEDIDESEVTHISPPESLDLDYQLMGIERIRIIINRGDENSLKKWIKIRDEKSALNSAKLIIGGMDSLPFNEGWGAVEHGYLKIFLPYFDAIATTVAEWYLNNATYEEVLLLSQDMKKIKFLYKRSGNRSFKKNMIKHVAYKNETNFWGDEAHKIFWGSQYGLDMRKKMHLAYVYFSHDDGTALSIIEKVESAVEARLQEFR